MLDIAMPDAHQPWCSDRLLPRSLDHLSQSGSPECMSEPVMVGETCVFLTETTRGVVIGVDADLFPLEKMADQAAEMQAAVAALSVVAVLD